MVGRGEMVLLALAAGLTAGCRSDAPRLAETLPDTTAPVRQVAAAPSTAALVPAEVRWKEADELDRTVMELRTHLATMRQISPMMASTLIDEHASHVRALGDRVAARRGNLPVPDAELPELLGMTEGEYLVLQEEIQQAAGEVVEMRGADEATVRQRLSGHLERLERIAGQMEHAAAALRR